MVWKIQDQDGNVCQESPSRESAEKVLAGLRLAAQILRTGEVFTIVDPPPDAA